MPVNYPVENIYLKEKIVKGLASMASLGEYNCHALIHETDSRDSTLISPEQSNRACAITGQPDQQNIPPPQAKPRPGEREQDISISYQPCARSCYTTDAVPSRPSSLGTATVRGRSEKSIPVCIVGFARTASLDNRDGHSVRG
ncbi:hypothetical protein TESG_01396 [Trichophyton tonsurans CBS 112818]|uniref:Uncharacterized protein n=1 Tax=Trichophyton tonsurans (strain CBS 112818) TaxID=647933 RepID=F2RRF6_TRIT1|nr:hypothetical protein TESG_01396 [Trichophyton tonsurans CBS 112818]